MQRSPALRGRYSHAKTRWPRQSVPAQMTGREEICRYHYLFAVSSRHRIDIGGSISCPPAEPHSAHGLCQSLCYFLFRFFVLRPKRSGSSAEYRAAASYCAFLFVLYFGIFKLGQALLIGLLHYFRVGQLRLLYSHFAKQVAGKGRVEHQQWSHQIGTVKAAAAHPF